MVCSSVGGGMTRVMRSFGVVLQDAGRLPRGVLTIAPPLGSRRIARDAGQLQRQAVGERHVSVETLHEHRVVGVTASMRCASGACCPASAS